MKKSFEDKIRNVIEIHNKNTSEEQKIVEVKVLVSKRIGFNGNEQIVVDYWTKK